MDATHERTDRLVWLIWGGLGGLAIAMVSQTIKGIWAYDIFSYTAPVREFADHGFNAKHSVLAGATKDPTLTPYTMVWGFVSRLTGLSPTNTLRIAAIVNLYLLGFGLFAIA